MTLLLIFFIVKLPQCQTVNKCMTILQPGETGEEPLYVNAKQYHRILKRRQARAKLEALGRIPKERQVCACVEG